MLTVSFYNVKLISLITFYQSEAGFPHPQSMIMLTSHLKEILMTSIKFKHIKMIELNYALISKEQNTDYLLRKH